MLVGVVWKWNCIRDVPLFSCASCCCNDDLGANWEHLKVCGAAKWQKDQSVHVWNLVQCGIVDGFKNGCTVCRTSPLLFWFFAILFPPRKSRREGFAGGTKTNLAALISILCPSARRQLKIQHHWHSASQSCNCSRNSLPKVGLCTLHSNLSSRSVQSVATKYSTVHFA